MTWRRRTDTRHGDYAHGITFIMYERTGRNIRAEATVGSRKLQVDGAVSLTLATGQYRYGDEVIAQVYTSDQPRETQRRADGWSRIQVYLGPADESTAQMLEQLAADIRRVATRNLSRPAE